MLCLYCLAPSPDLSPVGRGDTPPRSSPLGIPASILLHPWTFLFPPVLHGLDETLNITNYNPTSLSSWKANTDIQPVLDPYACIMYIVSYVTKDEREMGDVLHVRQGHAVTHKKDWFNVSDSQRSQRIEGRLPSAGTKMLSCSVKRVFVPTDLPDNRVRILKTSRYLEALDLDSEDIYMTGLVQRYAARPFSLNTMCLADFAVEYDMYIWYDNQKDDHSQLNSHLPETSRPMTAPMHHHAA